MSAAPWDAGAAARETYLRLYGYPYTDSLVPVPNNWERALMDAMIALATSAHRAGQQVGQRAGREEAGAEKFCPECGDRAEDHNGAGCQVDWCRCQRGGPTQRRGETPMKQGHFGQHWSDEQGNPAGGVSTGRGFTVSWQNGPLGRGEERREPNGAFVEDVLAAVIGRIEFYQASKFACNENALALDYLKRAAEALDSRTKDREARAVEGTHRV